VCTSEHRRDRLCLKEKSHDDNIDGNFVYAICYIYIVLIFDKILNATLNNMCDVISAVLVL
jgi:hypothetical protein